MEHLHIYIFSYISMCAAHWTSPNFVTNKDQYLNMDEQDCLDASPHDHLLINKTRPIRYTINFDIHPSYNRTTSTTSIMLIVDEPTRDIRLYAYELRILENMISLKNINTSSLEFYTVHGYYYCRQSQILDLQFDKIIIAGVYNLTIYSEVASPMKSIFEYEYSNENTNCEKARLFIMNFETRGARRMIPCWDQPGIKAIFNISVKHPKEYRSFSNMPKILKDCRQDFCWTYFNETPLISPTTIVIALVENNVKSNETSEDEIDLIWYRSELETVTLLHTLRTIEQVKVFLIFMTGLLNMPKRNHILFPSNIINPIGYFGLIIYREKDLLYNGYFDFAGCKLYITEIISYQMAREQFRGVITGFWWTDLWLGESLSKLYSHYIVDKIFSHLQLMDLYAIQILQQTRYQEINCQMKALSEYNIQVVDEIDVALCSHWYYNKGECLEIKKNAHMFLNGNSV
ncbi:aminopeptidase M1-C-like isoform X2 [Harpegnathos saltator]|uniref:aminopeptidase M1-C-like isoform X2 n=1 Tax=Harpegnathos saltator TaxID=610380 RepID=UPI000DBEED7F|nr:aminopeptidase M1-C-like isoform X2 [Harpegnathos saltator]XP_025153834.1 aminopeptidase M1-C-like isoform X2 [Harpegnathos saltator]